MSTPNSKRPALDGGAGPSPTSIAATHNNLHTDTSSPNNKRLKGTTGTSGTMSTKTNPTKLVTVLTYEILGSGVSVQVLSNHTVHDLVDIVCQETCVGMNESVYDHMWCVTDPIEGNKYESGDVECQSDLRAQETRIGRIAGGNIIGANLLLTYDYGTTSHVGLVLKSIEEEALSNTEISSFPRRAALPGQTGFAPYEPGADGADLDELYPDLSNFLFTKQGDKLEIFLFQPGKKKVQAYIEKEYDGCVHAMHVPEKFGSVEEMLYALNESSKYDAPARHGQGYLLYSWFGVSIFNSPTARYSKYKACESDGLNVTVTRGYSGDEAKAAEYAKQFLKTFPKCAAAAGFNQKGKPSKSPERGWIVYRNGTLTVCRGDSRNIKSNAPSPGVFDGQNKHEPVNDDSIVGKINIRVNSLQELFCAAEALW